jgi:hypothetical protein
VGNKGKAHGGEDASAAGGGEDGGEKDGAAK